MMQDVGQRSTSYVYELTDISVQRMYATDSVTVNVWPINEIRLSVF